MVNKTSMIYHTRLSCLLFCKNIFELKIEKLNFNIEFMYNCA